MANDWCNKSDEDSFVHALRSIDGQDETPMHCTGHLHRMKMHGFVRRDPYGRWHLTTEGHARAYPVYGELRVTRTRMNDAIHREGLGLVITSPVLYKTRTARESLRLTWYTPGYSKTIERTKREG